MASRTLLSPAKQTNWNTPRELFLSLDMRFHFTVDIAADRTNALCAKFFTQEKSFFDNKDGIFSHDVLWCNPPYGREIIKWVQAVSLLQERGVETVMLLPARVDTQWFHKYIYQKNGVQVHFIPGRVKFVNPTTGESNVPAAFPSMLVWFKKDRATPFMVQSLKNKSFCLG